MNRTSSAERRSSACAGFTLLEALAALAISAAVLAILAQLSGQALRNWNRGHETIASMEMLTRGIGRLSTDLSLALPMRPPGSEGPAILFKGEPTSLLFAAATGFGAADRGVELISITSVSEPEGIALVRQRGPVASMTAALRDPVVLLRGRMKLRFLYRQRDGQVVPSWAGRADLPAAVEMDIRAANDIAVFSVPVVIPLAANLAAECLNSDDESEGKEERCQLGGSASASSRATTQPTTRSRSANGLQ